MNNEMINLDELCEENIKTVIIPANEVYKVFGMEYSFDVHCYVLNVTNIGQYIFPISTRKLSPVVSRNMSYITSDEDTIYIGNAKCPRPQDTEIWRNISGYFYKPITLKYQWMRLLHMKLIVLNCVLEHVKDCIQFCLNDKNNTMSYIGGLSMMDKSLISVDRIRETELRYVDDTGKLTDDVIPVYVLDLKDIMTFVFPFDNITNPVMTFDDIESKNMISIMENEMITEMWRTVEHTKENIVSIVNCVINTLNEK